MQLMPNPPDFLLTLILSVNVAFTLVEIGVRHPLVLGKLVEMLCFNDQIQVDSLQRTRKTTPFGTEENPYGAH